MAEIVKSELNDNAEDSDKSTSHITIALGCDNSQLMKALSEVEEAIDRLQKKTRRLMQTINESSALSNSE